MVKHKAWTTTIVVPKSARSMATKGEMRPTFMVTLLCPVQERTAEHMIVSSILTDLIFQRIYRRRTALLGPTMNLQGGQARAMHFKSQNQHDTIISYNLFSRQAHITRLSICMCVDKCKITVAQRNPVTLHRISICSLRTYENHSTFSQTSQSLLYSRKESWNCFSCVQQLALNSAEQSKDEQTPLS